MYLKTVVFKNLLNIPLLIVIIDPYENHVLGLFGLFILFRLMLVDDELFVLYINLYDHQLGHGKRATCFPAAVCLGQCRPLNWELSHSEQPFQVLDDCTQVRSCSNAQYLTCMYK